MKEVGLGREVKEKGWLFPPRFFFLQSFVFFDQHRSVLA